ncbi:hypothetical protein QNI16_22150 [Cytophagaceae bacterium YF14B1]|uniref:Uncharacterized protein n=1 Tax=Xanthocytophaga flava TaxID=3048013 RepID=A0AAE3QQV8_9BACT|nr:hypothetical protein [Xanthocytophaga flavus]MDJ1483216.1 hypothetical protein [Xanthocytophaga flavus]
MTERRLTLFPSDPWFVTEDEELFKERLIRIGFWGPSENSSSGFILGRLFRELLEGTFEGIEYYHIPAWLEIYEQPKLQIGSDFQNLTTVKSPYGKEIGDQDMARELILDLRENPDATWQEPRFRQNIPIYELDFENYVAFGRQFLQLGIYLKPTESFLNLLKDSLGMEYRYANYWE